MNNALTFLKEPKIWALAGAFVLLGFFSINDVFVYIPDSARYLVWAESLAGLHGFVDLSGPDPLRYVVHAPLYAFLLLPAAILGSGNVIAAKIVTVLSGAILLILVFAFLVKRTGVAPALLGALFLTLNPLHVLFSTQILSDVPFGVLLILLLLLAERVVQQPARIDAMVAAVAALLSAAVLLREVGIALVVAFGVYFAVRREYLRAAVAVALPLAVYVLWFFRNEILVAGVEQPPLRNSDLFVSHLYTTRDASLFSELIARVESNFRIYSTLAGKLVFLTQYDVRGYGVIPPGEGLFGWILRNGGLLVIPTAALSLAAFVTGLWSEWDKRPSAKLAVFFLGFYLLLILVYPFNDIRFLFPLLLLMLLFGVHGTRFVFRKLLFGLPAGRGVIVAGTLCLALLAVPNAAWLYSFVTHNASYRDDPETYFASVSRRPDAPELLMFPMSRIGAWLSEQTDSSAVVASRWKQLSFWMGERKLLEMNPLLPVDQFENQLRDYEVTHLVVLVDRSRLREFETQMALSTRFAFVPVHRIGNAVIVRVVERLRREQDIRTLALEDPVLDSLNRFDEGIQFLFREGLGLLEAGRPLEAGEIFGNLTTRAGRSGVVVLNTAIAFSFAGAYERADTLLKNLRERQQAGALLVHSWYHLQINERLRSAGRLEDGSRKADLLTRVALDYWSLGFRNEADRTLGRALNSDPSFSPGLVFGVYFSLLKGDTARAVGYLSRLRTAAPLHTTLGSFESLIASADSARASRDPRQKAGHLKTVAQSYMALGLHESAIDELLAMIRVDPSELWALRTLAGLYLDKGRYAPAKAVLRRLEAESPGDPTGIRLTERLENRWGR